MCCVAPATYVTSTTVLKLPISTYDLLRIEKISSRSGNSSTQPPPTATLIYSPSQNPGLIRPSRTTKLELAVLSLLRLDRSAKTGGGVCCYIWKSLKAKVLHDLTASSEDGFQQLWFSLQHNKHKSLVVCVAYRPPNCPVTCYMSDLIPAYTQPVLLGKDIVITGDLNCDMLADSNESRALKDFCSTLNLTQLISTPTRVTETSETLIDVILTSSETLIKSSGVQELTISDHFIVHCTLNLKSPKPQPVSITTRSYKNFNPEDFCDDVSKVPWDTVRLFDHVDDQVSSFNKLFLEILDQHAPWKTFKAKYRKSRVMSPEIKELVLQRNNQLKIARQTLHQSDWEEYRILRRKVKATIRETEIVFVRNEISSNKENKSSKWKTVRGCLNSSGRDSLPYTRDCSVIANEFKEFFTSVGERAAKKSKELATEFDLPAIHPAPGLPSSSIPSSDDDDAKFAFKRVLPQNIKELIMNMPSNKLPGDDKISMRVIKACLPHILNVVTAE